MTASEKQLQTTADETNPQDDPLVYIMNSIPVELEHKHPILFKSIDR